MLHRFLASGPLRPGDTISLEGSEVHHAIRVRRVQPGESVEVFDGDGRCLLGRVESVDRSNLSILLLDEISAAREPGVRIELGLSLIQPERFEIALQKGTELGVAAFHPILSRRSEIPAKRAGGKVDRWTRILVEASKQSGRSRVPELSPILNLEEALNISATILFLDAEAPPDPLPQSEGPFLILVGPEGGWDPSEIEAACSHGAHILRLGPRRLRAETAAIAASVLVGSRYGDLG